jgi:CxxC-x17-CxxC domain-containing protein
MVELNRIRALTKTTIEEMENDISLSYRKSREMHRAVCSDCAEECEVPFRPDLNRLVFCESCWAKRRRFG